MYKREKEKTCNLEQSSWFSQVQYGSHTDGANALQWCVCHGKTVDSCTQVARIARPLLELSNEACVMQHLLPLEPAARLRHCTHKPKLFCVYRQLSNVSQPVPT